MVNKRDYSDLITKKDLEVQKTQFEALIVNSLLNIENYILALENTIRKLEECKDDVDKVVDEVIDGTGTS